MATCTACRHDYLFAGLGFDLFGRGRFRCPSCRADMEEELYRHVLSCPKITAMLAEQVEQSHQLIKKSHELTTHSAVLAAESEEVCRHILAMRREPAHTPLVIERIAAVLLGQRSICVDCLGRRAGLPADLVRDRIEKIGIAILITTDLGTCSECQRHDLIVITLG